MKTITTLLGMGFALGVNAQISLQGLNQNNVSAMITDGGFFFNNPGTNMHGYEIPSGSGTHTMYSGTFWFGGVDINGQQKVAAQNMYGSNSDLWPGPLVQDLATTITPNPMGYTLWSVTKAEIDNHIANFDQPGYIAPSSITGWPAHGDISQGLSYFLAPFVDVNYDGVYDPSVGDHPCIKGDRAVYTIMNDKDNVHGSGGDPLGIEVHFMFYQFSTTDYLNNTTFMDVDVYNRGTQTLFDFKMSFAYDGDIGNPTDDYFGCDSVTNMMYMYNGDAMDESSGGVLGYGANPPSAGIICLSHDMESAMSFNNGASYPYTDPANATQAWNIMNGNWADNSPVLDDNAQPTKFQFSGNPNNTGEWSELNMMNPPGDRRGIMTVSDGTLSYQDHKKFTFAVLYDRSGTAGVDNVNGLISVANSAQAFYDTNLEGMCDPEVMGVVEAELSSFSMYPNPSHGKFSIQRDRDSQFDLIIRDMSGRTVYEAESLSGEETVIHAEIPSGVYLVNIVSEGGIMTQKLIVE